MRITVGIAIFLGLTGARVFINHEWFGGHAATPTASPAPANLTGEVSAENYLARLGYGTIAPQSPAWDPSAPLNAIAAYDYADAFGGAGSQPGNASPSAPGSMFSGPGKVFFFAGGTLVGTDTTDGSLSVGATRVTPAEIEVQYGLDQAGDPQCCSQTSDVRFSWAGAKLTALDPIPPWAQRL